MADFNITAVLGADVSGFRSGLQKAKKAMEGLSTESGGLKEVNSSLQGLKKNSGGLTQLASGVGKLSAAIGITKAISIGISAINNSIGDAVSRVDTLNRFPKVLESMGVSTDGAEKSIKRLSDGIQGLPTALDDIAGSAQRMFTILGDMELATESTLALNNAFLASGASTADASRGLAQYTQMLSAGKVDMQSWRTLQETMPYALKETAEAFGFVGESATNDFYSALLDGDVTMSDFNAKLIELSNETGGFAETALTASEGIATSWQNLKTAIVGGVAGIIDSYNQWAEDSNFLSISGVIESMKEKIRSAFNVVIENVPVMLEWFKNLFETVESSTAFQTLKTVIDDFTKKGQELIETFLQSEEWALFKEKITQIKDAMLEIDFEELTQEIQDFIDKWSPLVAGIMGAYFAFKLITGAMTLFSVAAQLAGLAIAILTSPITLVALAIGLLIGIGVLLYKNWDTIKEKATELKEKISEKWEEIKENVSTTVENMKTAISTAIENMKTAIVEKFEAIKQGISDKWTEIKDAITTKLTEIGTSIAEFFEPLTTFISDAWDGIKTTTELVWDSIKAFFAALLLTIVGLFTGDLDLVKEAISSAWNIIKENTSTIWNNIKNNLLEIWENIKTSVSEKIEALKTNVTNKFNEIKENVKTAVSNLKDSVLEWFERLKAEVPQKIENMKTKVIYTFLKMKSEAIQRAIQLKDDVIAKITEMIDGVGTWISELPGKVKQGFDDAISAAKEFGSQALQAGRDLIMGFVDGVTEKASALIDAVGGAISGAIDWAKGLLGIHSPSRVFKQFGIFTDEGFAEGIKKGAAGVKHSMGNMVGGAITQAESMTGQLNNALAASVSGGYAMTANGQLTINQQPAFINLDLGGRSYRAFVEDISNAQSQNVRFEESYSL